MQDSDKYLIHASIRASGVVERSDVVGAIFGQTEGLLGPELDLHDLQESSKVGRIDVDIDSEGGRSFGTVTVASGLDRVETAVLAAALETIERVGPCRAELQVVEIEDARAAKREALVDRAVELLAEFDDQRLTSAELLAQVRERVEVGELTDYEGLPAGPRAADSDAVVVVEGRADVRQLLRYGVKNVVAVEGTDVPSAVAGLTAGRTVTAFVDGDRGGELVLRELAQVGDVDYVALAPEGESVEDLSRDAVLTALREKVPFEEFDLGGRPEGDQESAVAADTSEEGVPVDADGGAVTARSGDDPAEGDTEGRATQSPSSTSAPAEEPEAADRESEAADEEAPAQTLPGHVEAVVGGETGLARLLDADCAVLAEVEVDALFEHLTDAEPVPATVVLDGPLSQRVLDVAAQRGVGQVVAASTASFVKQPASVRVRTAADLLR